MTNETRVIKATKVSVAYRACKVRRATKVSKVRKEILVPLVRRVIRALLALLVRTALAPTSILPTQTMLRVGASLRIPLARTISVRM